ncbi:DUF4190 domain-containing protein [Pseudalkalibacillus hwajinpoensis]|uniref:DUF4190 domain-containing protein n=1 Tax=Guptibacillus hwajinpoensis TaxID=208199 RepID=UPI001CFDF0B5|nr:DUF4190 domain-containing protein [Pseudalkalibacillus hwajinpoensis]
MTEDRHDEDLDLIEEREVHADVDYSEEAAAEVAPGVMDRPYLQSPENERPTSEEHHEHFEAKRQEQEKTGVGIGVAALALSVISLFILPVILGAAGIVVGFVARRKGLTTLGSWAIGVGAASMIISLFFAPFF